MQLIKLKDIKPNPNQPRKYFDEQAITELSQSIKSEGVMSPIMVRPLGDKYEIIQGERRYRAAQQAGLTEIPSIIREVDELEAFRLAVIENIQREQMTPIEEAQAFMKYVELGYTHEQIAEKVSKSRTYVTSKLRLLKLSPTIQGWISNGLLADGHAKQILKLDGVMTRLLKNYTLVKSGKDPFELVQEYFHKDFWFDLDTGRKVSVKDVQYWADRLRHSFIHSIVSHSMGKSEDVVAFSMGREITAEFFCRMYNLNIDLLVDDDFDFGLSFEREYFKDSFNEKFRPWHLEKYWDDARLIKRWEVPRDLKFADLNKIEIKDKSIEDITSEIKGLLEKVDKAGEILGKSRDELLDEVLEDFDVSRDTVGN